MAGRCGAGSRAAGSPTPATSSPRSCTSGHCPGGNGGGCWPSPAGPPLPRAIWLPPSTDPPAHSATGSAQVSLELDERSVVAMPQRAFDTDELRAALTGRRQRPLGATILESFIDSSRRASLRVHEIVRANGDFSPFAFEKGVLLRG